MLRRALAVLALATAVAPAAPAQAPVQLDSATLAGFRWRSIGPANMMGRVTDVEGLPSPSRTFFVATAAGGIWKTTNAGTSFRPVFEHERVVSMGDIAIAPSDTMTVWAGTGEEDSRNSISPGGGIYKSEDGGLTWTLMGLEATQHIGRIVIHPTDPDIVYVAALGQLWSRNPERGLYKTTDGGETWQQVKFVSDRAGFVDVAMDPTNPDVLLAASWERIRGPYFLRSGGPGSALWRSEDAGATWTKVEGGGWPETTLGRIGIAFAPSNPDIVYTMVEADSVRGSGEGLLSGLYRSEDGGRTWERTNEENTRPFYYSQVRVDPEDPDRVYWSSTPVKFSDEGGANARNATVGIHVDHHAMWIDPADGAHFVVGNDGGVAQTWDRGGNYMVLNTIAIGQFYHVSYNWDVPYRVCGGLQDNGTWCGPSRLPNGSITNFHWYTINGGDGFFTAQDPNDHNLVYSESQGGAMARMDLATGARSSLGRPSWRPRYTEFEDSIIVEWPDTTEPLRGPQRRRVDDLRRRQRADSAALDLRWNWSTPFFISVHNPSTFYAGANRVLKSTNRGDDLFFISPDLTTQDAERIRVSTEETGGVTADVTGAETHSTITALAESPLRAGILFAGTDDGNVWMTRNDGGTWEELTERFPGLPRKTWVSRIEPSHHDSLVFYVTFDRHRDGDFMPYVYATSNGGATFRSIAAGLPTGGPDFVHVLREDPYNPDLLFVGTDVGAYVSLDRGASWQRFMTGLPTVPVHDLEIHPRDRELIAATHGRSIWIVDIAPLEQMQAEVLAATAHLFEPKTAYQYGVPPVGGEDNGQHWFEGEGGGAGAEIVYRLTEGNPRAQISIVITDVQGDTVQTVQGPGGPGLHRVTWNFQGRRPPAELSPSQRRDSVRQAERMTFVFDSLANAGMNRVMLENLRQRMESGDTRGLFRMFQGGGREGAQGWDERPGESAPPRQRGAGAGRPAAPPGEELPAEERPAGPPAGERPAGPPGGERAGGPGGPGGAAMMPDQDTLREIFQALRQPGQRGFGGFGGGGRGPTPFANTGDYLVSLTVGETTMHRVLRVERRNAGGAGGFFFEIEP